MSPCEQLEKYAKSREAAYSTMNRLTTERAKAVSKIRQIANFFSNKPADKQLMAIKNCEYELLTLLPAEKSRFKTLRNNILELIDNCHALSVSIR